MRNTDTAANGDRCPQDESHGKMFMLSTGRQYCAVQSHDRVGLALYEHDGLTPVVRKPPVKLEENVVAFRLPDKMKSALDPVPTQGVPSRAKVKVTGHRDAGLPAHARGDAPKVCRAPFAGAGEDPKPCGNCGQPLVPSAIRKSGWEHKR